MKAMLFLLVLQLTLVQMAFAIEVDLTKDAKIWLTGTNCEEVQKEVGLLAAWKTKLGQAKAPTPSCVCKGRKCKAEITDSVPAAVKKVVGVLPENEGPNCFNSSLVAGGILPYLRESSAAELSYWVNSPLCRKRTASEELAPGDILTIRSDFGKKEEHAFNYISDNLVFSKETNSSEDSHQLVSLKDVYKRYTPSRGCESFKAGPDCKVRVDAYDCMTLVQYQERHPPKGCSKEDIASVEKQESQLQHALYTSAENYYRPIISRLAGASKRINTKLATMKDEVVTTLETALKKQDPNCPEQAFESSGCLTGTDYLMLKGLQHRIQSIKESKIKFE